MLLHSYKTYVYICVCVSVVAAARHFPIHAYNQLWPAIFYTLQKSNANLLFQRFSHLAIVI